MSVLELKVEPRKAVDRPISEPWQREFIMDSVDFYTNQCGWKQRQSEHCNRLLWLLPESRVGEPLRNPIDSSPIEQPDGYNGFNDVVRDLIATDAIFADMEHKHKPNELVSKTRECIICQGSGWRPGDGFHNECKPCNGTGYTSEGQV